MYEMYERFVHGQAAAYGGIFSMQQRFTQARLCIARLPSTHGLCLKKSDTQQRFCAHIQQKFSRSVACTKARLRGRD
jgi:hypothetical protein